MCKSYLIIKQYNQFWTQDGYPVLSVCIVVSKIGVGHPKFADVADNFIIFVFR